MERTLSSLTAAEVAEGVRERLADFLPEATSPQPSRCSRRFTSRAVADARHRVADARRAPAAGGARPHDAVAADKATLMQLTDQAFRSQSPAAGGGPVDPHPRRAGRAAVLRAVRSHAAQGLPVVRGVPAGRGDAAGQGEDAAGDGQRHPAGRSRSCWREHLASPPRRGRADERQLPGRGAAGRGRMPSGGCRRISPRCSSRRSKSSR